MRCCVIVPARSGGAISDPVLFLFLFLPLILLFELNGTNNAKRDLGAG
jgi:hypothetical protein